MQCVEQVVVFARPRGEFSFEATERAGFAAIGDSCSDVLDQIFGKVLIERFALHHCGRNFDAPGELLASTNRDVVTSSRVTEGNVFDRCDAGFYLLSLLDIRGFSLAMLDVRRGTVGTRGTVAWPCG